MLEDSGASAKAVSCPIMNPQRIWEDRETPVVRLIDSGRRGSTEYELRKVRRFVPFSLDSENKP